LVKIEWSAIVQAGQNSEAEEEKNRVQGAINTLETIGTVLSPGASLVVILNQVIPALRNLFGLS
jgi:hypothetical protein